MVEHTALKYPDFIDTPFEGWKLDSGKVRELSRLSPARSAFHVALEWIIIFAAIFVSHRISNPLAYIAAIILIGSRQHALLLLMHEAAHRRLFNSKRLNDWICEVLVTWPVLVSLRAFRHTHLQHHRHLNLPTDGDLRKKLEDPDWHFPLPRRRLLWSLAKQFTGLGIWYVLKIFRYGNADAEASGQTRRYRLARVAYYISVLAVIVYFRVLTLFLVYWIVPLLTCLIAFNRMRVLSEHPPIERASVYGVICTYRLSLIERILFAPKNCHYHIEHHSYPSVPFFNLGKLHRELKTNSEYRAALRPVSYWELLKSLSTSRGQPINTADATLGRAGDSASIIG
ncbi:MAG: fatty acid desaturase family protein [Candidatus Binataceae bacterium]